MSSVINAVGAAIVFILAVDHTPKWSSYTMLIGSVSETGSLEAFCCCLAFKSFVLSVGFYPGPLEPGRRGY